MFSNWTVALVANFLNDCEKVGLAESSSALLQLVRENCSLNQILFDTTLGRTERFSRVGWKLAKLEGALEHCAQFSNAQRAAVTHFYSRELVTDPRFCRFPNLRHLEGRHETRNGAVRLSQLEQLTSVRVHHRGRKPHGGRQKMELPESLTNLHIHGVVPDATSFTLEQLSVMDTQLHSPAQCNFPAVRSVHCFNLQGPEHILACLSDELSSLTLTLARPATFRVLFRFRLLRVLSLEMKMVDESFAELLSQLPETLEHIKLTNTSILSCWGLKFSSFAKMQDLQTLMLMNVGGNLDMNDLRDCRRLYQVKLLGMHSVENQPKDPQTIWPFLHRSDFKVQTRNL